MHSEDEVSYGADILPADSSGAVPWPEAEKLFYVSAECTRNGKVPT